jgi:DNA-binding MarR family transcriptional regulator
VARTGPPTVLFDVFWAHQKRKRLVEHALGGVDLPAEDYPFYVTIGADGPLTPTALAEYLLMPLEGRGHAERVPNPDDGRSFLLRLTPEGQSLLDEARPAFRDYAESVEARLGREHVESLTNALAALRDAIDEELSERAAQPDTRVSVPRS